MDIYIDNRQEKVKLDQGIDKLLKEAIRQTLLTEKKSLDYEISISFVDNLEIRELNRNYRNMDRETDVLSFPLEDGFQGNFIVPTPLLGDIIISVEKALEQSIQYKHSLTRELVYLTVHSTLHLLGYDHMEEDEKRAMRNKEKDIMRSLQIFKDKGEVRI